MTLSIRWRWPVTAVAAAAITGLVPGVAAAAPPANDDFDTATTITALPFNATQDITDATVAPDDPDTCFSFGTNTVWFRYTATEDALVELAASATEFNPIFAAFTGTRGELTLVPGVCGFGSSFAETFRVTAGTTYHIVVRADSFSGPVTGSFTLRLETVPPPPNDSFATAEPVTALPASIPGNHKRASAEPGEPLPSCDRTGTQSVWYVYRPPTTRSVSASTLGPASSNTVTAYRGSTLTGLTELDCTVGGTVMFRATVGETYYLRVANNADNAGQFTLQLQTVPPPTIGVNIIPDRPSVLDEVLFFPFAADQFGRPLASGELRFGDGASAPITSEFIRHRYATDGTYRIEMTATTQDGRTGTGSTTLVVETHDVSIASFTVPTSARAGQTKPITVTVANTRRDETVQVELMKRTGNGSLVHVGTLTQWVPARPNRTVPFPFAYTFSEADTTAGTVTFQAVATLPQPERDAVPDDNVEQGTTTVRQRTGG